jgi:hypothetical protein
VTARTPDGKYLCGHSFRRVDHVPGGMGRDERILARGLLFLQCDPDWHDTAACGLCTTTRREQSCTS